MNTEYFLNNPEIQLLAERARKLKDIKKRFSDIIDKDGNQYVDLVQEGGGVLGIALIGYTYILENAGIRFFNLAGASAGAINSMLIASIPDISKEKSEQILAALSEQNLFDFVDGGKKVKRIVNRFARNKSVIPNVIWNIFHLKNKITKKMGLNPGIAFENWISDKIATYGIKNLADLKTQMSKIPELFNISDGNPVKTNYSGFKLAIIATDATTKTKVEFPRMAELYWDLNVQEVNPASFVRASMSIPFFFEPYTVKNIPANGDKENLIWHDLAGYYGEIPKEIKFVDGGLMSNFPINIFHIDGLPKKPTLGVRLSAYREQAAATDVFGGFMGGMLDAIRQQADFDFLFRHPDYKHLICKIDADKTYNWLDFNISEENKLGLFKLGATRAINFLEQFDWDAYKELRKKMNIQSDV
jgi:NTE family protein